jgi:hypothetical protein
VYSIVGLTSALYDFSFTFGLLMLMFHLRKLSVLFARLHIFAMWVFHLKSDDTVTPSDALYVCIVYFVLFLMIIHLLDFISINNLNLNLNL